MAVSNVLYVALKALAQHIEAKIPQLAGHVHAGAANPEDVEGSPCVVILPGSMVFSPSLGVDEIPTQPDQDAILDVGQWEGTIEIRISAKSMPEREQLETRLQNLFLTRARRGVLVLTTPTLRVDDVVTLYKAPVAFSLLSGQWNEEAVWDKKRYSYNTLELCYPALVAESSVPTIDEIHSVLTNDLASVTPTDTESFIIDDPA